MQLTSLERTETFPSPSGGTYDSKILLVDVRNISRSRHGRVGCIPLSLKNDLTSSADIFGRSFMSLSLWKSGKSNFWTWNRQNQALLFQQEVIGELRHLNNIHFSSPSWNVSMKVGVLVFLFSSIAIFDYLYSFLVSNGANSMSNRNSVTF